MPTLNMKVQMHHTFGFTHVCYGLFPAFSTTGGSVPQDNIPVVSVFGIQYVENSLCFRHIWNTSTRAYLTTPLM